MRYRALATDYDGTIAHDSAVDEPTIAALERLRASGRTLILVTGRELAELKVVCPRLDLFEWVVSENGAQLYRPSDGQTTLLGEPPPAGFVEELKRRGVGPISVGGCIVATWEPHENTVLNVIRDLGLEMHVIFNKGAVMILPAAVNKATGLTAALERLGLSPHEVVGVGDAENDHAFLNLCEFSAAVSNALPALKERADLTLTRDHGAGVAELIDHMLADDLAQFDGRARRHQILLGTRRNGKTSAHQAAAAEHVSQSHDASSHSGSHAPIAAAAPYAIAHVGENIRLNPFGNTLLIAGPKGSGKSSIASGLAERLGDHGYQYCMIDPEGDFAQAAGATVVGGVVLGQGAAKPGDPKHDAVPTVDEASQVLKNPRSNLVVNLSGLPADERPAFFHKLLARLLEFRVATGRPHWILVDEAQQLFPRDWTPAALQANPKTGDGAAAASEPPRLDRLILAAVRPSDVSPAVLAQVRKVLAVGPEPHAVIDDFCAAIDMPPAAGDRESLRPGEVLVFAPGERSLAAVRPTPTRSDRLRRIRRRLEGDLSGADVFVFRGPDNRLKLRAQNLNIFQQMAEGVDPETWKFHLARHDVSQWFAQALQDDALAAEAEQIEAADLPPEESLARITQLIEKSYRSVVAAAGGAKSPSAG
jgi:hydroxymethylpyrimidine pyrophosphatase-like HAD family hydrolase